MVNLKEIFHARSIAIIGASNNPRKATHQIIKTMIDANFSGKIFPIHPKEKEVLGFKCYSSILDIKKQLDLLVIGVPAKSVLEIFKQASRRKDIKGAIIISAGFSETADPKLVELENEIISIANKSKIRVFGPNCIGLINSDNGLCTSFAPGVHLESGNIGFITQSGAFGGSVLMLAGDQPKPLGFNKWAHVGNMADVSNLEILEYFGSDEKIKTIGMYLEGVSDGRALLKIAREISSQKPIFLLKVGRTDLGSKATLSHTGTLAGSDQVYEAAFTQSGIVRVNNMEELVDALKASSMLPKPNGRNICVLTEAGGPGIIAMDEIAKDNYLKLAQISKTTRTSLKDILPSMAMVCKPNGYIDMTAAAMEKEHEKSLQLVLEDPNVDSVILITLPPTFLPAINVAQCIEPIIKSQNKPVVVCLMKGEAMNAARKFLEENGIPTFDTPDRAARAMINITKASSVLLYL